MVTQRDVSSLRKTALKDLDCPQTDCIWEVQIELASRLDQRQYKGCSVEAMSPTRKLVMVLGNIALWQGQAKQPLIEPSSLAQASLKLRCPMFCDRHSTLVQ